MIIIDLPAGMNLSIDPRPSRVTGAIRTRQVAITMYQLVGLTRTQPDPEPRPHHYQPQARPLHALASVVCRLAAGRRAT